MGRPSVSILGHNSLLRPRPVPSLSGGFPRRVSGGLSDLYYPKSLCVFAHHTTDCPKDPQSVGNRVNRTRDRTRTTPTRTRVSANGRTSHTGPPAHCLGPQQTYPQRTDNVLVNNPVTFLANSSLDRPWTVSFQFQRGTTPSHVPMTATPGPRVPLPLLPISERRVRNNTFSGV